MRARQATPTARSLAALAAVMLGALAALTGAGSAHADPESAADVAKGDRLFAEGKALLASNLLQACAKFDESLRANPAAIGTLLNVALCDEKLGRVATAVARFAEARDRAVEQGLTEHVRAAEQHIAALTPDIPHLAINITSPVPNTTILIDDRVIPLASLASVAVDPGERVLVVSAPERLPYRTTLVVARGDHQSIAIPALARSIVVHSSSHRIGQITTIVGGAAVVTGIGLGLYARHLYLDQFGHAQPGDGLCDAQRRCEPAGRAHTASARTLGNVGTAVGLIGLAVAAGGGYLWYRSPDSSPSDDSKKLTVVPSLGPDGLGIAALGRF